MTALLASKMPVADASNVLEHLTGMRLPRAPPDPEARREGERAQALRTRLDEQAATKKKQLELTLQPCQMIIQLDAWNIRKRDHEAGTEPCAGRGRNPNAGTSDFPHTAFNSATN
jgi:hypothetical protein